MLVRVVLMVGDNRMRKELHRQLAGSDVLVEIVRREVGVRCWDEATRRTCDLLVVDRSAVPDLAPPMVASLTSVPDAPGVAVIAQTTDAVARAAWLAVGCQAVLEPSLPPQTIVDVLEPIIERRRELAEQRLINRRILGQPRLTDFASRSPAMRSFVETVQRVVNSEVSLLLLGETGVGKERLARAIHGESRRRSGPFVAINCGALPETLLESELFGHERGAFTGATQSRRGCFELAHGGTLFLDEIGELPHHLQVKLLRVLQEHEIRRLGAERPILVDVRIMAATNRDLEREVAAGSFRQDLFYRLSVMVLTLPPLRHRREDIPELIDGYIEQLRPKLGSMVSEISGEARDALLAYAWPGNVRELVNVLERAMLLCPTEEIGLGELPLAISGNPLAQAAAIRPAGGTGQTLFEAPADWLDRPWREIRQTIIERAERSYLAGLLERTGGRIAETARLAGMQERSLFEKMRYYGLRKEDFRPTKKTD